jgi:hypothetical protein
VFLRLLLSISEPTPNILSIMADDRGLLKPFLLMQGVISTHPISIPLHPEAWESAMLPEDPKALGAGFRAEQLADPFENITPKPPVE